MAKDNLGLVAYAKKALSEHWGYVWGTFGQLLTPTLLAYKLKQYPDGVGNYKDFIQAHWLNRKVTDCVGLIKSYMWFNGSAPVYNSATDCSADGMYSRAKEKGAISSMPDIPGICVHKSGHIGVYIGNGQVIEAHGTKYGVIQTPLKGTGATAWEHWLKCPYINYNQGGNVIMALVRGNKGAEVSALQTKLNKLGYKLAVDGSFGPATEAAVKDFQTKHGLEVDGKAGPLTMAALDKAIAPATVDYKAKYDSLLADYNKLAAENLSIKNKLNQIKNIIG